jgi:hypothetical protein
MKFKVILTVLSIIALSTSSVLANDGKYTLTYKNENKWVAKEDISPLRQAIVFFSNNKLDVKAVCSDKDTNCAKRVEILNLIFKKQKVNKQIDIIEKSTYINKNSLIVQSVNLDPSKYTSLFINYEGLNVKPVAKSVKDITSFLKNSNRKYLSQFKMYCAEANKLCKDRFNHLNSIIGKTLPFKYNIELYTNENLDANQAQLINHRHDYNIAPKPTPKPITTGAKEAAKKAKEIKKPKVEKVVYSNDEKTIVFKPNNAILMNSEKVKIEKLIADSKNNKFNFACDTSNELLCQSRVHEIKNYALANTSNIIEMYQITNKVYKDHIIIYHAQ